MLLSFFFLFPPANALLCYISIVFFPFHSSLFLFSSLLV
jgi:hypothetical protein